MVGVRRSSWHAWYVLYSPVPVQVMVHSFCVSYPGKTAYYAWKEFSDAKPGQTAFVTAGSGTSCRIPSSNDFITYWVICTMTGPVGSMVIQIAKEQGLKVIASAGSDDKVEFMKSIGADVAFNYKTSKTLEVLQKEGPIDV